MNYRQPVPVPVELGVNAPAAPSDVIRMKLAGVGMGLFVLAAWVLHHPYGGLAHDSILYTLLALVRLHPDTLSHDIFLRFGSQDSYTVFGPLYAAAIRLLDLEPAAAILTFVSHCAFFGCGCCSPGNSAPGTLAVLATGLLAALASPYGATGIFHYTENFLTPRLPAEALVLAAITAMLAKRYAWAAIFELAALLLHPLMGSAGIAMLAFTFVAIPKPRFALVCGAILLVVTLLACVLGIGPFKAFGAADAEWLQIIRTSSPFLFVSLWSAHDWVRDAVPLTVLTVGLFNATTPSMRNVCAGALLTGLSGILLTAVYCDALKTILIVELQPWRWLWLTDVVAVLMSPIIVRNCWRSGLYGAGGSRVIGEVRGYFKITTRHCLPWSSPWPAWPSATRPTPKSPQNYCSWALMPYCSSRWCSISRTNAWSRAPYGLQIQSRAVSGNGHGSGDADGTLSVAVLLLAWYAFERAPESHAQRAARGHGSARCGHAWIPRFRAVDGYSLHPGGAHGLCNLAAGDPSPGRGLFFPPALWGAWYLLERASYWSAYQAAGAIFSKQKAVLLHQRTNSLTSQMDFGTTGPKAGGPKAGGPPRDSSASDIVPPPMIVLFLNRPSLQAACRDPDLGYVVSWTHIAPSPVDPVTPDPRRPDKRMYLYRCADFRT